MLPLMLYPLQVNPINNEPHLRLPHPYSHIVITPPRAADALPSTEILNDPRVYPWMGFGGPQNPYTYERAEKWIASIKEKSDAVLRDMENADHEANEHELRLVAGCPIRHIREVMEDGTEIFIGDIGIDRAIWTEIVDKVERQRFVDENAARNIGDPELAWQVGYYLDHGKGLMTTALQTLIHQWAIPRMGVCRIRATSFEKNQGSLRLFAKNGFLHLGMVEDCVEIQGERRGLNFLEWRKPNLQ